jgi:hypothetical protein
MKRPAIGRCAIAACIAAISILSTSVVRALTPTPTPRRALGVTDVRGRVFDASRGSGAPIAGVHVELHVAGRVGEETTTDADGAFGFTITLNEDDWVGLDVAAEGFIPFANSQTGLDLWRAPRFEIGLQPRHDTEIHGRIFDDTQGPDAGIPEATVDVSQATGRAAVTTEADGTFTFTLSSPDDASIAIWFSAAGYVTRLESFRAGDLRRVETLAVGLQPAPTRVVTAVGGVVYDAARGLGVPIGGADVHYEYNGGGVFPNDSNTVRTGVDGRYQFELPLGPGQGVELWVQAPGFASLRTNAYGSRLTESVDIGLAPLGGMLQIESSDSSVIGAGRIDVTITNVAPPGETLVILDVYLYQRYGSDAGMGFTWDLSQVEFPVLLESGEQLSFPLFYDGNGQRNAATLTLHVDSGARDGADSLTYLGYPTLPPDPTPTGTPSQGPDAPPSRIVLAIGTATGHAGDRVTVPVRLDGGDDSVTGVQIDLDAGDLVAFAVTDDGDPACRVNPDIDKNATTYRLFCDPDGACTLRAIVLAFDNVDPIPSGAVLFECDLLIDGTAAPGRYPLSGWNVGAADPAGHPLPAFATDGAIEVLEADGRAAVEGGSVAGSVGGCQVDAAQRESAGWLLLVPLLLVLYARPSAQRLTARRASPC